jgi:hypothetical protein
LEAVSAQRPARSGIEIDPPRDRIAAGETLDRTFVLKIVGDAVRASGFCDTLPGR